MKNTKCDESLTHYALLLEQWGKNLSIHGKKSGRAGIKKRIGRITQALPLIEPFVKSDSILMDLGSGVGIPAIPIALAFDHHEKKNLHVHLIEAQHRRAILLMELLRRLAISSATVHHAFIEKMTPLKADIFTASKLAPLDQLLTFMARHKKKDSIAFFFKGRGLSEELQMAQKKWIMKHTSHPLEAGGVLLILHHWEART